MSGFDEQNQAPDARDQIRVEQHMSLYLDFDEEGLVPEEYVSLVPDIMLPVALETEVQDLLVIEEGEGAIWFHIEQIENDEDFVEPMDEDYEYMNSEDENDHDEAIDEGTEKFSGTVNDHNYQCTHVPPNEPESKEKAETDMENQKEEDDNNPNSATNKI
ncbi:rCG56857 [Rattus norvegicus]|uniref:RCG56857 n=2 Tax=Rattus norvegicus TaxID=10116 RepID=A6KNW9_RAT|nr:rCG56857 [Rattus norvegicus]